MLLLIATIFDLTNFFFKENFNLLKICVDKNF